MKISILYYDHLVLHAMHQSHQSCNVASLRVPGPCLTSFEMFEVVWQSVWDSPCPSWSGLTDPPAYLPSSIKVLVINFSSVVRLIQTYWSLQWKTWVEDRAGSCLVEMSRGTRGLEGKYNWVNLNCLMELSFSETTKGHFPDFFKTAFRMG